MLLSLGIYSSLTPVSSLLEGEIGEEGIKSFMAG
jgi:hypothetical protein